MFSLGQKVRIFLISHLGWALVRLIGATLRYRVENWEKFQQLKDAQQAIIYSFWHNQIFSATHFWRARGIVVITSRHFDGEYIGRVIKRFGYGAARGSSGKGAVRALLELKKHLEQGTDVAFTIDGPKGPLYQVKPGPLWLSKKTGAPIVPFHLEPKCFWTLNSWDRFRIPKPFSPALVVIGEPLLVPPHGKDAEWMPKYQEEMERIKNYCEHYWSAGEARV